MNYTLTNSESYNDISISHYETFKKMDSELFKLNEGNKSYDFLSHVISENEHYTYIYGLFQQSLMISIVFQAFAVEAFVNFVAVNLYEQDEFFGKFDMMNTEKKIRKIFSEKLNSDFSKFEETEALIKILFELRDRLVHYKSKRINLETLHDSVNEYDPFEFMEVLYNNIDKVICAYKKMKELLFDLNGFDILTKQSNDLNNEIRKCFEEVAQKMSE